MTELRDLLDSAAGSEPVGFTTADVERRVQRRVRRRRVATGLAGAVVFLVIGAASWMMLDRDDDLPVATEGSSGPVEEALVGDWVITGLPIVAGRVDPLWMPTLSLEADGSLTGFSGCNELVGTWREDEGALVVDAAPTTSDECVNEAHERLDEAVVALMESAPEVAVFDETIELRGGDLHALYRKVVVSPEDLVGQWDVTAVGGDWPDDMAELSALQHFRPGFQLDGDGSVNGMSFCNGFSGEWSLDEGQPYQLGLAVVTTDVGCPGEEEWRELLYEPTPVRWLDIDPDRLVFVGDERRLELQRVTEEPR